MTRSRLTLDLSKRLDQELERLSEKQDTTKAGVLKNALRLLLAADEALEEGLHVGAWKEEHGVRTERVFVLPI